MYVTERATAQLGAMAGVRKREQGIVARRDRCQHITDKRVFKRFYNNTRLEVNPKSSNASFIILQAVAG